MIVKSMIAKSMIVKSMIVKSIVMDYYGFVITDLLLSDLFYTLRRRILLLTSYKICAFRYIIPTII